MWVLKIVEKGDIWTRLRVVDTRKVGKVRVKTTSHGWRMVNSRKMSYHLSWNGERFAFSNDYYALEARYPDILDTVWTLCDEVAPELLVSGFEVVVEGRKEGAETGQK